MPTNPAPHDAMPKHGGAADKVGMWLSIACAVHCLAMPILLVMAPSLAAAVPGLDWIEWAAVGLAFVLTLAQLFPEYMQHKKPSALGLAVLGLALLATGLGLDALQGSTILHKGAMVLGSLVMAGAFYIGHRLRYHA